VAGAFVNQTPITDWRGTGVGITENLSMRPVGQVADGVTQQIAAEGCQGDTDAWAENQQRELTEVRARIIEHHAPIRIWRLDAQP
jgi:hypothetical protein